MKSNKVWVLNIGMDYEGSKVLNVFSDEDMAKRRLKELKPFEGKFDDRPGAVQFFDSVFLQEFTLVAPVTTF